MFSFIIPTCIKNKLHLNQLHRCIDSVRKFHKDNKIILINDSDDNYDLKSLFINDNNIFIENTLNKGSADQQLFKVFLEKDTNDKAFFMQDSMLLNSPLDNIENIKGIKYIWHFTNHALHWDNIHEPKTEFNIDNNIITHTDLIRYRLLTNYNDNNDFINFALDSLNSKNKWCCCFGSCCIIDRETLMYINSQTNFINKFVDATSNRDRRANETIFALICHYYFPEINFQNSYDGLYYDGIHENPESGTDTGFDNLVWCCKRKYVSKISFNR